MPLPCALRRRPAKAVRVEQAPRVLVRLAGKDHLNARNVGILLDLDRADGFGLDRAAFRFRAPAFSQES